MRNRGSNFAAWQARLGARQLRAHEALAELERAQRVFIESRTRTVEEAAFAQDEREMNDGAERVNDSETVLFGI